MGIDIASVDVNLLMAFLECLKHNEISVSMAAYYLAAIKARFTVHGLNAFILDDERLKYCLRFLSLNRPVSIAYQYETSTE